MLVCAGVLVCVCVFWWRDVWCTYVPARAHLLRVRQHGHLVVQPLALKFCIRDVFAAGELEGDFEAVVVDVVVVLHAAGNLPTAVMCAVRMAQCAWRGSGIAVACA